MKGLRLASTKAVRIDVFTGRDGGEKVLVIKENGDREYYLDGKRHRPIEEGPAVERADGTREWWVNGVQVQA